MQETEIHTRIDGEDSRHFIFVDQFDDGVWISMNVPNGRTHLVLTKDQAKDMIAALIRVVEAPNA